jgi:PadR family transcriptional regulator, regulatory protein PadR
MARNGTKSEIAPPATVGSRPGPGPWEAQLRKGAVEMAALAALWNGRLYGLEIIRFLEQHSQLVLAEGTVYPILNRLKAEAMLTSEWVEADAGHPRKYYSLTSAGRQRLRLMAAAWTDFARGVDNLLQPVLTHPAPTQQEQTK